MIASEGNGKWVEYAGGYSDMIGQRGGDLGPKQSVSKAERRKERAVAREKSAGASSQTKMTFKDKHALDTLPGRMAELQAEIDRHQTALADPDLFRSSPDRFDAAAKQLEAAQGALAAAEEQWLELEMKREAIEAD